MRNLFLSAMFLAALTVGCSEQGDQRTLETSEGSGTKATPAETESTPAEVTPVEEAKPETTEPAKEEVKTPDVILPSSEPTKDEAKAEEPKADEAAAEEKSEGVQVASAKEEVPVEEGWGTLMGRFVYDGTAPEPIRLVIEKDKECCMKYADELVDQSLVVGEGSGIANVFVYVISKDVKIHPELEKSAPATVTMDHEHCYYQPHAMGVWAGKQTVVFGNKDPIKHAVQVTPFQPTNPPINVTLDPKGTVEYKFGAEERVPVTITCGIHPWEKGTILPRENPYFAVTSSDGSFSIPRLPVGNLEFQVWQERSGYLGAKPEWKRGRFELEIKSGANDLGEIKCDPSLFEKK